MYKRKASWLKHLDFTIGDVFCLLTIYLVAHSIRKGNWFPLAEADFQQMILVLAVSSVFTSVFFESYQDILRRGYYKEFREVIRHLTIMSVGVLAYVFFIKHEDVYSRMVYAATLIIGGILMYIFRIFWKNIIRKKVMNSRSKVNVLVIADASSISDFIKGLSSENYSEYQLVGCVPSGSEGAEVAVEGIPVVCRMEDVVPYVHKQAIDEVLIQPDRIGEGFKRIVREFVQMGITVHVELSKIYGEFTNMSSSHFGGYPVTTVGIRKVRIRQLFLKRTMDITGAVIGMLLFGVAFIIYAPIIKKQSPGPVIFKQERIGRNGRKFKIWKFRSMYVNAEEYKQELMEKNKMKGLMFKVDDDPRITPIGRFMRKTSIDELPQFWNVLKGDMSLVGTRPPTVDEFEKYEKHHRIRLSIKPGITGLWQVSGRSDIVDFEEVVKLDEKYVKEWNFGLDIKILLKTFTVVLGRKGSV